MELSRRGVFTALVLTVILSVSAEVLNLSEELEEDGYFRKEHSLTKPYTGKPPSDLTMTRNQSWRLLQVQGWTYPTGTLLVVQW